MKIIKSKSFFVFAGGGLLMVGALALALPSCSAKRVGGGNPQTLAPLLGGGGPFMGRPPATNPDEKVVDYSADLSALTSAWPAVDGELPRLIRAVIARDSWKDMHHAVAASGGALRVRHRPDVVEQVKRLVQTIRARLLRPLSIQVAFVEAKPAVLASTFSSVEKRPAHRFDAKRFRAASKRGDARYLARAVFSAYNGQWSLSDRVSNQVILSGVSVEEGALTPTTTALASGHTIQAAAWRWGEKRAIVALTGSYMGNAAGGQAVSQTVHRELPRQKSTEHKWEAHEVKLQLPVREMVEFQNQLTVSRGAWTVASLLPRGEKRLVAVLVKVDWRSKPPEAIRVDPLSGKGFSMDIIPIALPTDARPRKRWGADFDNRRQIEANSAGWFKKRAKQIQAVQKKNTYNLQNFSGALSLSSSSNNSVFSSSNTTYFRKSSGSYFRKRGGQRLPPTRVAQVMPEKLERLRAEVMSAKWPQGTALEFMANHVFVVHQKKMTQKVRQLLEWTHDWRNQRILVDVAFPKLSADETDNLGGAIIKDSTAKRLRAKVQLPSAFVHSRGGAWGEIFVGEMHAILSSAWSPDRSSPAVHVFWRGARLAIQPLLAADKGQRLALRFKQHRLDRVAPAKVAGAILQRPIDSLWTFNRSLRVFPVGSHRLTGMHGAAEGVKALLVTAHRR